MSLVMNNYDSAVVYFKCSLFIVVLDVDLYEGLKQQSSYL